MFGGSGPPPDAPLATYLVPMAVAVLVLVLRNSRPRRLKIERLWLWPAAYLVLMVSALSAAPPPVTATSIGLLVLGFLVGGALGWQRGRFMRIDIHPETHDLTSRASPIGLVFILAIFALRMFGSRYLAANAGFLGIDVLTAGDAFLVLAVAMLATQRLEVWRRASAMLEDARSGGDGAPPPSSIVS